MTRLRLGSFFTARDCGLGTKLLRRINLVEMWVGIAYIYEPSRRNSMCLHVVANCYNYLNNVII